MDCQKISDILSILKVDSLSRLRNRNEVIDKLHSEHLKDIDNVLMDVRVYVAKISVAYKQYEILKMIDEFIYKKQIDHNAQK